MATEPQFDESPEPRPERAPDATNTLPPLRSASRVAELRERERVALSLLLCPDPDGDRR